MRLIQFVDRQGRNRLGRVTDDGTTVQSPAQYKSTYELAMDALASNRSFEQVLTTSPVELEESYSAILESNRILTPLDHPDPAHCLVSGTGLTHLGSAATRDAMHIKAPKPSSAPSPPLTDSMQMFQWGIEGGRPSGGVPGAQPEWFFKGDGGIVRASGQAIVAPDFAADFGEEPELVGLYVIAANGQPVRLGYAIGNEFSDHILERRNYLYLAHSKLRHCGVGPELLTGELPADLRGTSRILRDGAVRWEKPFFTGEANMCHTLANLEYHHFKYAQHRRPGDVHLHFFGTATLSFADNIRVEPGDVFEVELPALGAPLRNPLAVTAGDFSLHGVRSL
jgi:hypothetical protein